MVGPGWSHQYEAFIDGDPEGVMTVHWDAVRENRFRAEGGGYVGMHAANRCDILRRVGQEWRLRTFDGTEYRFDSDGRLIQIANKINQELELSYMDDLLTQIVEPSTEREINLFYVGGDCADNPFTTVRCPIRLRHVMDQAERVMFFSYDDNFRLSALRDPATLSPDVFPEFASAVVQQIPDNEAGLAFG